MKKYLNLVKYYIKLLHNQNIDTINKTNEHLLVYSNYNEYNKLTNLSFDELTLIELNKNFPGIELTSSNFEIGKNYIISISNITNYKLLYEYFSKFENIIYYKTQISGNELSGNYIVLEKYNNTINNDNKKFNSIYNKILKKYISHLKTKAKLIQEVKLNKITLDFMLDYMHEQSKRWCYDNNITILNNNNNNIISIENYKYLFPNIINVNKNKLKITKESIFSISKPIHAEQISKIILSIIPNCHDLVITDATANAGGNTINFSTHFRKVYSIEYEKDSYECLVNNIKVYNLKNVETIYGDFLNQINKIRQDIVFIDPPWGGTSYKVFSKIDLTLSGKYIGNIIKSFNDNTKLICIKAPLNFDLNKFSKVLDKFRVYKMEKFLLIACFR
jgi:16S rRNA G966 N2-methylase RsmD